MKFSIFNYFVRNIYSGDLLEKFLISAVSTIIGIRFYLELTDYPQIGGEGLHISHMLWGGFLLLIAVINLLVFLNRKTKPVSAIIGGIGFGVFIDELGKFISKDNDYFFQPTFALIYIIFIIIFLIYKLFDRNFKSSEKEYAINAVELVKDVVLSDFDTYEKEKAIELLEKSDQEDPFVVNLTKILKDTPAVPIKKRSLLKRFVGFIKELYFKIIRIRLVATIVVNIFIFISVVSLLIYIVQLFQNQSFENWGLFISSLITGIIVLIGVYYLRKKRYQTSYEILNIAILISIFITQFFLLYKDQLSSITRLGISLVVWNALQSLIQQEKVIDDNSK